MPWLDLGPLPIKTRFADIGDFNFIMSSWLKSWRKSHRTRHTPSRMYFDYQQPLVHKLIARPDVNIRIAHAVGDKDDIYGWLCWHMAGDVPVVHYCYVKHQYRRRSVMRRLFAEAGIREGQGISYSCETPVARKLLPRFESAAHIQIEEFAA